MHPWIAEQLNREHIADMRGAASDRGRNGRGDRSRTLVGHRRSARRSSEAGAREIS